MVEARLSSNTGGIFAKLASTDVDDSRDFNTVQVCKRRPVTQLMRDGAGTLVEAEGDRARGFLAIPSVASNADWESATPRRPIVC